MNRAQGSLEGKMKGPTKNKRSETDPVEKKGESNSNARNWRGGLQNKLKKRGEVQSIYTRRFKLIKNYSSRFY